jgi:hypothetical protein
MKLQADNNRTDRSFQIGDMVLLKLQPYAQGSVVHRPFPKPTYKFFGPFEIVDKMGSSAYKLQLPNDSKIHLVFHVSQLKEFTLDFSPVYSTLLEMPALDLAELSPEKILDRHLVKKGNAAIVQVLIQWSWLPTSSTT